jgi:hypothetical protein
VTSCDAFACGGDVRILAVCGSLQPHSKNLALPGVASATVPPGVKLLLFDGLRDLPHFNPDIEVSGLRTAMETGAGRC